MDMRPDLDRKLRHRQPREVRDDRRAKLAEQIATLVGWAPTRARTPREKALYELWREWASLPDVSTNPEDWPELNDGRIDDLERRYDERARRLGGGYGDGAA